MAATTVGRNDSISVDDDRRAITPRGEPFVEVHAARLFADDAGSITDIAVVAARHG